MNTFYLFFYCVYAGYNNLYISIKEKLRDASKFHGNCIDIRENYIVTIEIEGLLYMQIVEDKKVILKKTIFLHFSDLEILEILADTLDKYKSTKRNRVLFIKHTAFNNQNLCNLIIAILGKKFDKTLYGLNNFSGDEKYVENNSIGLFYVLNDLCVQFHKYVDNFLYLWSCRFTYESFLNELALDFFLKDKRTVVKDKKVLNDLLNNAEIYRYCFDNYLLVSPGTSNVQPDDNILLASIDDERRICVSHGELYLKENVLKYKINTKHGPREFFPRFVNSDDNNKLAIFKLNTYLYNVIKSDKETYKNVMRYSLCNKTTEGFNLIISIGFILNILNLKETKQILENRERLPYEDLIEQVLDKFVNFVPTFNTQYERYIKEMIVVNTALLWVKGQRRYFDKCIAFFTLRKYFLPCYNEEFDLQALFDTTNILRSVFSDFSIFKDFRETFLCTLICAINDEVLQNDSIIFNCQSDLRL